MKTSKLLNNIFDEYVLYLKQYNKNINAYNLFELFGTNVYSLNQKTISMEEVDAFILYGIELSKKSINTKKPIVQVHSNQLKANGYFVEHITVLEKAFKSKVERLAEHLQAEPKEIAAVVNELPPIKSKRKW